MAYVAFVPARSGSKRLPGKNIKMLADKPLVVHTLEAFINAQKVDQVIFSTDSQEYWEIAKLYIKSDKLTLDYREPEEAGDRVKIFNYLKDNYQKVFPDSNDVFLMGLPTVPLRSSKHVNEAIELFEKKGKPVFSATEYGFPISFAFYDEGDQWTPVFESSPMLTGDTRSQDQKIAYHPNGAIYVRKIKDLESSSLVTLYQNAEPYLMNRTQSVDIDNPIDFLVAGAILANGN